jgi:hypothetical protein
MNGARNLLPFIQMGYSNRGLDVSQPVNTATNGSSHGNDIDVSCVDVDAFE